MCYRPINTLIFFKWGDALCAANLDQVMDFFLAQTLVPILVATQAPAHAI